MTKAEPARIHPTAVISPEAELADDVMVGPHVVIEGPVRIGPQCTIRAMPIFAAPSRWARETPSTKAPILGERPQHLKYNGEPTGLEIGDGNIFREYVTVHRGTTQAWTTRIGSHNFFMVSSHVAHDCRIGNRCILANGALVGGHCIVEDNVYLSGNCRLHQFVRVGRLALLSGCSASTKDIPPFVIQQGIDTVVGVNVVGMRRAGLSDERINAVRRAFRILFHQGLVMPSALALIEQELRGIDVVEEFVTFIRQSSRGINPMRSRRPGAAA